MNSLHSFLIGISLLFALFTIHLLLSYGDKRKLTRFLSIVILSRVGQILILLSINSNLEIFPSLYKGFTATYYLAPCCLYFYVKLFLNKETKFGGKDWFHIIPFGIAVLHFLTSDTLYTVNWDAVATLIKNNKNIFMTERTGILPANFMATLRISLMISYLIMSWNILIKSDIFKQKKWKTNKLWIVFIISGGTIFQSVGISALFINYTLGSFPWFLAIHCLLLVFLVLFLLHKPEILYGYLLVNVKGSVKDTSIHKNKKSSIITPLHLNKTDISDYSQNTVNRIELEVAMESKKLFLEPNLQILDLANALNMPVHQCSSIINNVIGKNFRDWCNSLRVQYFIEIFPVKRNLMTIESIANESGFKSITTFYNAFKKETGMMPKQYFKDLTSKAN